MKQKNQLAILAALLVVAALVWYAQGNKTLSPGITGGYVLKPYQPLPVENPELHWSEIPRAQKTEYKSNSRNPFSLQAPPPPVNPGTIVTNNNLRPRVPIGPQREQPPQPPTWPGNVSFFGYGTVPNGTARLAFLSVDGEVQVLGQGDTLLGRFKIVEVNNGNLEFQEISTGLRNTKALDAEKGSPPA